MVVPASMPTCGRGGRCGRKRVARLMRQASLAGCHRRRRRPRTTIADPAASPAPNLVQRHFNPLAPDQLWLADITSIPTGEGWLYLATVLDAFSRRVVGWAMADHLRTELVLDALTMALATRRPAAGLIHHSDRGCQYTSLAFGRCLQAAGLVPSMSRVANCWDNAVAERCFATLKGEARRPPGVAHARAAARSAIFDYVEGFYNRQRRHSTLGYLSPAAYEAPISPRRPRPWRNVAERTCRMLPNENVSIQTGQFQTRPTTSASSDGDDGVKENLARDAPRRG